MAGGDLYAVLGLTRDASGPEIRGTYQRMIADIDAGQAPAVQRQAVVEAFEILGDPIRRLRYDAQASAPPPPHFQMPVVRLPGKRFTVPLPRRIPLRIPRLRRIDPLLGGAIALVVIVGLVVLLLPFLRGGSKGSQPAQSVADLVVSPTATQQTAAPAPTTTPRPAQAPPSFGLAPGQGIAGGLLPGPGAGSSSSLFPSTAGSGALNEPPFLTVAAIVDMLRAVAAATAVRNGPPQTALGAPGSAAVAPSSAAPAGVPITSLGSLPSVVGPGATGALGGSSGFSQPAAGSEGVGTPTAPTATPAPNHIVVPSGPPSARNTNNPAPAGARPSSQATVGPNRLGPPTVTH